MSLLAIDIGSSACKAVVFTASGEILAQHAASYQAESPRPSFAEISPDRFWQAICSCAHWVSRELKDSVRALCLSSHGETFVPVNTLGDAVGPAILNQDSRATAEADWCRQTFGRKRAFEITGLISHPMYPLPKILWLRKHRPDLYSSTASFVTLIGYILLRMGLPALTDCSLASRYFAFDIRQRRWSDEILHECGLDRQRLPEVVPTGTVAGELKAGAAGELGLSPGTPVVLGGHDQPCGALGVGVIGPGRVADSIGTYECLVAASDHPTLTQQALSSSLNTYCHVIPDKFVTLAYFPSGIMIKWFHDLLYVNGAGSHGQQDTEFDASHYSSLELNAPPGPTGLCITPHLIGTCNPDFNPHARGIITGLTPSTDRSQLHKGILEGIACEFAELAAILADAVGDFDDVYVTGGGSRSTLGLKLRAALSGRRLHTVQCPEAVCLGSAILAGVAIGNYSTFAEAVNQVVRESTVLQPEPEVASNYTQQFQQYRRLRKMTGQLDQSWLLDKMEEQ